MTKDLLPRYWIEGTRIIEQRLIVAQKADWSDAPLTLGGDAAELWHRAQAIAYRDALEMMGVPEHIMKELGG